MHLLNRCQFHDLLKHYASNFLFLTRTAANQIDTITGINFTLCHLLRVPMNVRNQHGIHKEVPERSP